MARRGSASRERTARRSRASALISFLQPVARIRQSPSGVNGEGVQRPRQSMSREVASSLLRPVASMPSSHNLGRLDSASRPPDDELGASAERALTEWRAAFDERLESLEQALHRPGSDLGAIILDFARVAGEEAEATARHAALEAQLGAQRTSSHDRRELDEAREAARRAEQTSDELRRALEGTRRAHEDTRRSFEEARDALEAATRTVAECRNAAAAAETRARHGEEERRELVGIQAQLTEQLEQARLAAADGQAQASALRAQLVDVTRRAEAQAVDLHAFRHRLEDAVRDAEERSLSQEQMLRTVKEEQRRWEQAARDASVRTDAAVAAANVARHQADLLSRELESLRPQFDAAQLRVATLEQEVDTRGRDVAQLHETVKALRAPESAPPGPSSPIAETAPRVAPPLVDAPFVAVVEATAPMSAEVPEPATMRAPMDTEAPPAAPPNWFESMAPPGGAIGTSQDEYYESQDNEAAAELEASSVDEGTPPTGVFSTVADALRAWATETDALNARLPETEQPAAPLPSAPSTVVPARPRPAPAQYDAVRRFERHDLSALRIAVTVDREPGTLVDLSAGGAQVVTCAMLKPGRQVRVTFPASGPLATGLAKIAWSRLEPPTQGGGELQYRAGLSFTKIEQRTIERVLGVPQPDAVRESKRTSH